MKNAKGGDPGPGHNPAESDLDLKLNLDAQNGSKSPIRGFFFGIFNSDTPRGNVLTGRIPIGLRTATPQCSCDKVVSHFLPRGKEQRKISTERCRRFNMWYRKCCQSAVLRQPRLYYNLVKILEQRIIVDGQDVCVGDVVLGQKITLGISLDIRRTYPSLRFFTSYGRRVLRRILMAYAFFDPQVGYVQGLNFIVANLIWHSLEEQAFWVFISLMYLYDCRCMFIPGLVGVFKRCQVLEHCMSNHLPRLHEHLSKVGVFIPMIASDWFMTLCANSIPIGPLGALWDAFFSQGWIAIYRFIMYRLQQLQDYLLTMSDVADIMKVIKYGNATVAERRSLFELIPGFGSSVASKGADLISDAYQCNVDNVTNDPNRNNSDDKWNAIVEESLAFKLDAEVVHDLELNMQEVTYYDCDSYHKLIISDVCSRDVSGLVSCESASLESDLDVAEASPLAIDDSELGLQDNRPYENLTVVEPTATEQNTSSTASAASNEDPKSSGANFLEKGGGATLETGEKYDMHAEGIQALRDAGYGDLADELLQVAKSFHRQLGAIQNSGAYSLHLRALLDD